MASSVLKLFYLLNNPEKIDFSSPAVALDSLSPPTLLITNKTIAKEILKAEEVHVFNLIGYWESVTRLTGQYTTSLRKHFSYSPLLQSGTAHRHARKTLLPTYKLIEEGFENWLPEASNEFFKAAHANRLVWRADEFAEGYIRAIFKRIICAIANANDDDCPPLPGQLFSFFLRKNQLETYCSQLQVLHDWISLKLPNDHETNGHDLLSITVMGREPMVGALAYGINQRTDRFGQAWTATALMDQSSPVSELIAREVAADFVINEFKLKKGQILHISPFLLEMHPERDGAANPLTFGHGPHLCLGRAIALKITEAFLNSLAETPGDRFEKIEFLRDNVLSAKR